VESLYTRIMRVALYSWERESYAQRTLYTSSRICTRARERVRVCGQSLANVQKETCGTRKTMKCGVPSQKRPTKSNAGCGEGALYTCERERERESACSKERGR